MGKSPRLAAAKIVAQRKALTVLKDRYTSEIRKIEEQLKRPLDVQLQVPKEIVQVAAPNVSVDAPKVEVTVPENAIQVIVKGEAPTVNTPVQVTIPENAIQVQVKVSLADHQPVHVDSPVSFNPKIQLPEKRGKTTYRILRHQYTDQIEGIEAID